MASSGSFNTSSYNNRGLTFNWWINSQSISGNYTDIGWSLVGNGSKSGYYMAGGFKVVIDGETVYSKSTDYRIELWNGTSVASGTKRIYHDSVGKKKFSASAEAGIYYYAVNCSGSGSWDLTQIPRYTSITSFSVSNISGADGLTKVKFNWSASDTCDYAWYSKDNGTSWSSLPSDNIVSGLSPNTSYNFKLRVRRKDSQLTTDSGTVTKSTYNIATLTAPNDSFSLNSNGSLTCTASNPSGANLKYYLDLPNGTRRYASSSTTATSYTWSAAQILELLKHIPSSNNSSIKVGVATLVGSTETYFSEKTGTLYVVNSNPEFNNFTYTDTNSDVIALTGNNQIIVKGYSHVKATIIPANKAVAKNYANMSKYRFIIGSSQKEVAFSDTKTVEVTINNAKNNVFTMYAIDSRGNSANKQISPSRYIEYSPITIKTLEVIRNRGVGSESTLKLTGAIWEGSFGNVLNEIKSCYYRYKETKSNTWITGETKLTPTREGSNFSFEGLIKGDLGAEGFSVNKSFDIQVLVQDKLSNNHSAPASFVLGTGTPAIAITKNGVAIMGMYDDSLGGALQIVGDLYVNGVKIN